MAEPSVEVESVRAGRQHDLALFARYNEALSEGRLRDELNGQLYNRRTDSDFTRALQHVLELAVLEEGRFVNETVQEKFEAFTQALAALRQFLALHFFGVGGPRELGGTEQLMLYPELRHKSEGPDFEYYDTKVDELNALCEATEREYLAFRQAVKKKLVT